MTAATLLPWSEGTNLVDAGDDGGLEVHLLT